MAGNLQPVALRMSLPATDTLLPFPSERDLDEVRSALEHARRSWHHADVEEALRSLKRAARGAAERDQVERALELSKAAAELASLLDDEIDDAPRRSMVIPSRRPLAKGQVPSPPRLPTLARGQLPSIPSISADSSEERPIPLERRSPAPSLELATASLFDDDDEPTAVRAASDGPPPLPPSVATVRVPAFDEAATPIGLTASRVAVFLDPARQRLEVRPLGSDEPPPSGAPVAMLVASSVHDAEGLAALLRRLSRWQ